MTTPAQTVAGSAFRAILWGAIMTGTFDLVFAFIFYGLKIGVLQSIAAGLLGSGPARQGGIPTAILGIVLHFLIAAIWAGIFWIASRRLPFLIRHFVAAGLAYGLIVFYGMNSMVLPLSAMHAKAWPPPFALWPVAMHMLIVGLPIAWATRHFSRPSAAT